MKLCGMSTVRGIVFVIGTGVVFGGKAAGRGGSGGWYLG
jgi:hypothetical protein